MTEEERKAPVTRGEAVDLTNAVNGLTARFKWQQRLTAGLVAVAIVTLLLVGGQALEFRSSSSESSCVRAWANASSSRTSYLVPLSDDKNSAMDGFVQALATKDQVEIQATYIALLRATQAYEAAETTHQPVPAPKFTC